MKPWYRKKKVWAAILGALLPVLTVLLLPDKVETIERLALAIIEAGVAAGFIFAESSIDKAGVKLNKDSAETKEMLAGMTDMIEKIRKLPEPGDHDDLLRSGG